MDCVDTTHSIIIKWENKATVSANTDVQKHGNCVVVHRRVREKDEIQKIKTGLERQRGGGRDGTLKLK